jgi:hypothetical protein
MKRFLLVFVICPVYAQSAPPPGNFVYIDQVGNYNTTYVYQDGSEQNQAAIVSNGDNNTQSIFQEGPGNHTALIGPAPTATSSVNNNNNFTINQSGGGNHTASIINTDPVSNSNNTASITQSGGVGANKQFTLSLQGNGIGATVVQDNPTQSDSASMSIQCLTPPCSGYSYTKH